MKKKLAGNRDAAECSQCGQGLAAHLMLGSRIAASVVLLASTLATFAAAATPPASPPDWLTKPLSLADALNIAEQHNATILKAKKDLEAAAGLAIQTRAIVVPKVQAKANYQAIDSNSIDKIPLGNLQVAGVNPLVILYPDQSWSAGVQLVQSVYEGGRLTSSLRTSRLLKEQAALQYQAVLADALTEVRVVYCDILLAEQLIKVQEASTNLLFKELEDTRRRFDAGTVPRFNVLRAEVELANAQPKLIRAKNAFRIFKNDLANLLGFDLPKDMRDDLPLTLSDQLEAVPREIDLPTAVQTALRNRPELGALRKSEALRKEGVISAKAGYLPRVQVLGGYGARTSQFTDRMDAELYGWSVGAQATWDIFDGAFTKGKVQEARALHEKSQYEVEDGGRRVELEVRSRYSQFIEAREVLDSTKKVEEQAVEALRLATSRADAGTGTQLDVLNAQTSLTDARSIQVQALRDYVVALARLERAMGSGFVAAGGPPAK